MGGEKGSADTERDPRGFAVKFYTEEGNYDMTGNNTPVFFIRDPLKFADFIHTQKRDPRTNLKDPDMFWDFLSLTPESVHQVTILFSDRGTPDGYRHMNGYSSHSYVWSNAAGEQFYVQYHFKTEQGSKNLTGDEADALKASDPDYATRDLFEAIERGDYPLVAAGDADHARRRGGGVPLRRLRHHQGVAARRLPADDDRPDGAGPEPRELLRRGGAGGVQPGQLRARHRARRNDKMLQARLFSYHDTHIHRLGPNYHLLPVNAPKNAPERSYQRDGLMRFDENGGAGPNYWPNSFGGPAPDAAAADPGMPVSGETGRTPYPAPQRRLRAGPGSLS